jgi:hypothetical protein
MRLRQTGIAGSDGQRSYNVLMPQDESERLSPEQERALYGFGQSSALNWGKVILLQLERISGHQREQFDLASAPLPEDGLPPRLNGQWAQVEISWRIRTDAHFLILSLRHLLRYGPIYTRITGRDPRVRAAYRKFETAYPAVTDIRDGLEHRDERVLKNAKPGSLAEAVLGDVHATDTSPTGELLYIFGEHVLPLKQAGYGAVGLATRLDEVWQEKAFGRKLIAESFSRSATV